MTEEQAILEEKGRDANHDLSFRSWNKSKHAQWFTPLRTAHLVCSMVKEIAGENIKHLTVLDPTAGTGRLLYPFKRNDAQVLGIELDTGLIEKAKMLLGKESIRSGSILEYAPYLQRVSVDIAVTNPPYGITWSQEETSFQFKGLSQAGNIESQNAVLQIVAESLDDEGLLFAIIPTSTFDNAKDDSLRQSLYKNFTVLFRATIKGMFKEEYGIDVETDIVAAQRRSPYDDDPRPQVKEISVDWRNEHAEEAVIGAWKPIAENINFPIYPQQKKTYFAGMVPYLDNLIEPPWERSRPEITERGLKGNPFHHAMLDFHQETVKLYNPVVGKPTGLRTAFLDTPALLTRGAGTALNTLMAYGYDVTITPEAKARIEAQAERFKTLAIPIYRPKDHQRLAYFEERAYRAKADVCDLADESEYRQDHRGNGEAHAPKLLFKAGRKYYLRPSWVRQRETAGIEVVGKGKDEKTITTNIDRGFLSIEINTEQGKRVFREPEPLEVAMLIEAFGLPEVKDIGDIAPEKVEAWKKKLLKTYPNVFTADFDYQAEDLARLLSKTRNAYLGYEMGGGKTVCALVFQAIRGVRRVLIVAQSSLVENWIAEAAKFGFIARRFTTHKSVDELQREIRGGRKPAQTEYYVTSYEFLSLDTGRVFDPWECEKFDKDGNTIHHVTGNRGRTCAGCSTEFPTITRKCPKCGEVESWTGKYCLKCRYSAYTYSGQSIEQYPGYKRFKKLFGGVIIDEAQAAKSKTSFRGQACRSLKARSKLILTGTLMKGYITDVFFNIGWTVGHNNPLFPYRYDARGSKGFAEEYGTFEYKDTEYDTTLHKGRKKQLPEVSNLNRFWKILSSFTIRRLKDEMVKLPPKNRRIMALTLDPAHASEYASAVSTAQDILERELRKSQNEINMGAISKAIWGMRFAATIPRIDAQENVKIREAIRLTKEAQAKGEKVLVYSALREMQAALHNAFLKEKIEHIFIPSTIQTKDRFSRIKRFTDDPGTTAIIAGLNVLNRGFTITSANHVVFTDVEFSPESTAQAEDRAHRTGQDKPVTCYYLLVDWAEEKENIDFRMYNLITQKQRAISNAIDGKVRFAASARVLSAGGDYLAIAKAVQGITEDALQFEYEKVQPQAGAQPAAPEVVIVTVKDNGLWDQMYQEKKAKMAEARKRIKAIDETQFSIF